MLHPSERGIQDTFRLCWQSSLSAHPDQKRLFKIVMSGRFCTLAMFLLGDDWILTLEVINVMISWCRQFKWSWQTKINNLGLPMNLKWDIVVLRVGFLPGIGQNWNSYNCYVICLAWMTCNSYWEHWSAYTPSSQKLCIFRLLSSCKHFPPDYSRQFYKR